ncbi:hypothetical protein [Nitrosomonas sp. ANs5]|uniref:hypothetical protein n=1 Tax=Nitrosomonas sp. ANs5 TaxID=3423941 RepID=UPI003D32F8F3
MDQIFNLLHQEYGREEVNAMVTERAGAPQGQAAGGAGRREGEAAEQGADVVKFAR